MHARLCLIETYNSGEKNLGHFSPNARQKLYKQQQPKRRQKIHVLFLVSVRVAARHHHHHHKNLSNDKPIKIVEMIWHRIDCILIVCFLWLIFGVNKECICFVRWFPKYFFCFGLSEQFMRPKWSNKPEQLESKEENAIGKNAVEIMMKTNGREREVQSQVGLAFST